MTPFQEDGVHRGANDVLLLWGVLVMQLCRGARLGSVRVCREHFCALMFLYVAVTKLQEV